MLAPMSLFHSLQFLPLFVRERGRDLSMSFVQDFTDTLASVTSHLLELRGRSIKDRRYLGHLFWGRDRVLSAAARASSRLCRRDDET